MTTRPEMPPRTRAHRPFPVGDIIGEPATRAAKKLLELTTLESDQELRFRLRWMRDIGYESWLTQGTQSQNIQAIVNLANNWDNEQWSNGEPQLKAYFLQSFQTSVGFVAATNFLPLDFKPHGDDLQEVACLPLSALKTLVGEAEHSMRSHPRVHEILPRLAALQADVHRVTEHDENTLLAIKYGTYLPYILSSISSLERYIDTHLSDSQLERIIEQARNELGMN